MALLRSRDQPGRSVWLKTTVIGALALAGVWLVVRLLALLPPLDGRIPSNAYSKTNDTRLGQAIHAVASGYPGLSGIHALAQPREAFAARVLLARAAERSIDAQYYIWHDDLTGSLLFDELRAAANRGVQVRLLLDDNNTAGLDPLIAALDAQPNIEIRLFNPFVIRRPRLLNFLVDFFRLNRRMHNKSFTVDNQATIIGGRNIGDEYFGAGNGASFVDLDVLAAGPVVPDVSRDFDKYWASASSYPAERIIALARPETLDSVASRAALAARDPQARQYVDVIRNLPLVSQLLEQRLALDWVPVRLISDDPAKALGLAASGELMVTELVNLLEDPRRRLDLISGYFVPTATGLDVLTGLARRGVEVNILTNSLEATDVPIVHAGYAGYRKPLLEAGVKLWELRGPIDEPGPQREITGIGSTGGSVSGSGVALHAKTFSADGARVFVGSFNFDPRSARLNTELGFVIRSPTLARTIDDSFVTAIPQTSYEPKLTKQGELYWIEWRNGVKVRHDTEPGTSLWQRTLVFILSLLPIEWLL